MTHVSGCLAASENVVLEVDVFEAGKVGRCGDVSDFDKERIVTAR